MLRRTRIEFLLSLLLTPMLTAQEADRPGILFADTSMFHCSKLEINTRESDFGVTAYGKGYVFSSSRNNQFAVKYYTTDSLSPLLDLYYFERKDSSRFSSPRPFSDVLNSKYNEGPAAFSSDEKRIVYTGNVSPRANPDSAPDLMLTLLASVRDRGRWKKAEPLPFCTPGWNYVHPSFSPNDSILIFASDRPGGFGGMDIYYSRLTASGWGAPVNLGPRVNTAGSEVFPFCPKSGNFYFSSDRPGGNGKLDIYAWDISDSAYSKPVLLGPPVNSAGDDFSFWCSANEQEGFFSSNRDTRAPDDDIYFFRLEWPVPPVCDTLKELILCYTFFEEATSQTEDTVGMAYEWTFSDGTKEKGLSVKKCFDTTGTYFIELNVIDASSGEVFMNQVSTALDVIDPNAIRVTVPEKVHVHEPVMINSSRASLDGYSIVGVYYDFGNGHKSRGITAKHIYHKPGVYYPLVLFRVRSKQTGMEEYRALVTTITVEP